MHNCVIILNSYMFIFKRYISFKRSIIFIDNSYPILKNICDVTISLWIYSSLFCIIHKAKLHKIQTAALDLATHNANIYIIH